MSDIDDVFDEFVSEVKLLSLDATVVNNYLNIDKTPRLNTTITDSYVENNCQNLTVAKNFITFLNEWDENIYTLESLGETDSNIKDNVSSLIDRWKRLYIFIREHALNLGVVNDVLWHDMNRISADKTQNANYVSSLVAKMHRLINYIEKQSDALSAKESDIKYALECHKDEIEKCKEKCELEYEAISELGKDYNNVVAKLTADAVSNKFDSSANDDRKISEIFRLLAIVCMIFAVFIIIDPVFPNVFPKPMNLTDFLIRLSSSISIGLVATYFARQSTIHRERSFAFKQFTLDSYALKPLIANLSKDTQDKITEHIALNYLFKTENDARHKGTNEAVDVSALLQSLIDLYNKKP
ncbi:hypothetical protein [uncultured Rheinheimera sp.]|uniref:hypothetical protein n=1 Tax=uncultured Rheinheimera sp. TaxID=400532 RepID=UPI0025999407|nr:hypothetical protein [uncultured Rheinheimera sp.]